MDGGAVVRYDGYKIVMGKQAPDWWYGPRLNCTNGTGALLFLCVGI